MKRHTCKPRKEWRKKSEEIGFTYHSHEHGPYWDESACYELTSGEVDALEAAANELHRLCLDTVGIIIQNRWWPRLGIPEMAVPRIIR